MGDSDAFRALGSLAFVWGYPMVRAAQLRANLTKPRNPADPAEQFVARGPLNAMAHARALATPQTRVGVAPNNDTLYSLAWLDLASGPFILETPDFGQRYYTFQMGQADSSTDRSLGQRTHGAQLPPVVISGPGHDVAALAGMEHVRSRYRYLLIAGRILIDGSSDLPAVHGLQDRIVLRRWGPPAADASGGLQAAPVDVFGSVAAVGALPFMEQLAAVIADIGITEQDAPILRSLASVGLLPATGFRTGALGAAQQHAFSDGLRAGEALVRAKTRALGHQVNGWSINYRGADFGADHLLRAAVAMDQIYIVEAQEALYPSARVDSTGEVLDGQHSYRIQFRADTMPPVGAFWSITLYFAQGFMVPNGINRWSIGDRTPGLDLERDGALEILVQNAPPANGSRNWLPAPREPFMLLMRLYHPLAAVLSGAWVPPAIEKIATPSDASRQAEDGCAKP